jgi:hypothetical protein
VRNCCVPYRKHFISLVENEHLHAVGLEETALDHVLNTTGSADNNLRAVLKGLHILTDTGTTDTSVALDLHEISDGNNDLLDLLSKLTGRSKDQSLALLNVGVDLLENRDGEGGGLSSTGLGLSNDIVTLDNGHDSTLLDSRRTLETVGID